ncbi:unnamed protein product [Diplocarpon coronariae]
MRPRSARDCSPSPAVTLLPLAFEPDLKGSADPQIPLPDFLAAAGTAASATPPRRVFEGRWISGPKSERPESHGGKEEEEADAVETVTVPAPSANRSVATDGKRSPPATQDQIQDEPSQRHERKKRATPGL